MKTYIVNLTDSTLERACPYLIQASGETELAEILDAEFGDMDGVPDREVNVGDEWFILPLAKIEGRNYFTAHFNDFADRDEYLSASDNYDFWNKEDEDNSNKWQYMKDIWGKTLGRFWKEKAEK